MDLILKDLEDVSQQMEALDHNMTRLHFINESLSNFNESNGALIYGLMCNTWSIELQSSQFSVDAVQSELDNIKKIKEIEQNIAKVQSEMKKLIHPLPETNSALKTLSGTTGSSRASANMSQYNAAPQKSALSGSSLKASKPLSNAPHKYPVLARATANDTTSSFLANPDISTVQPLKNDGSARSSMPNRAQSTLKTAADRVYKNRRKSSILNSAREKSFFETPINNHTERHSLDVGQAKVSNMGPPQQRTSLAGPARLARGANVRKNERSSRYTSGSAEFRSARPSFK